MKILALQIRPTDDPMLGHEQQCFHATAGLNGDSLHFVNIVEQSPNGDLLDGYDALLVGGSGNFSMTDPSEPFLDDLQRTLVTAVDRGFPTFASCFGFQALVRALGGGVVNDPDRAEVGSFTLRLTEAGREDELFSTLPSEFVAQQGHLDHAVTFPDGLINLVSSDRCRFQALRVPGKPIWATQFHPELDREANLHRYRAYMGRYEAAETDDNLPGFTSLPSPAASRLLPAFLDHLRADRG